MIVPAYFVDTLPVAVAVTFPAGWPRWYSPTSDGDDAVFAN